MSSAGCALPAKMICTGRSRRVEDAREPLRIVEDQLGPLVAGEAAREADRQRVRVEQRAGGDDARRADVLVGPALARALADEREQIAAQRLAHRPQLLVGDREHAVPQRRIVVPLEPVGAEIAGEQRRPARAAIQVGTCTPLVTDVDRPLGLGHVRPDRRPHRARHLAVQLADGVDRAGRAQRERRHVELRAAAVVVARRARGSDRGSGRACPSSRRGASRPGGTETRRGRPAPACAS